MALVRRTPDGADGGGARRDLSPREAACAVAGRLADRGHVAYFAGGCVRDALLKLEPADYDIATSATPEEIRAVFRSSRGVGESFGVNLIRLGGRTIEVATFRSEGEYTDGRRPSHVTFSSAEADARRRDFSINGLFEDPRTGKVIDFVGGQADLAAGLLRAIDDPDRRMQEDRLRTLRAARFAARFSLKVDPVTEAAVVKYAPDLAGVSRERVGVEFRRMMDHPSRSVAAELIERWGLDAGCLGESNSTGPLVRLSGVGEVTPFFAALAAWRLDRAGRTPPAGSGAWHRALMLSNRERDDFTSTLESVAAIDASWDASTVSARKRLAAQSTFAASLAIAAAANPDRGREVRAEVESLEGSHGGVAPDPFVTGHDLIAMGAVPGPLFKELLDSLYDAQLEGQVVTREEAHIRARSRLADVKN